MPSMCVSGQSCGHADTKSCFLQRWQLHHQQEIKSASIGVAVLPDGPVGKVNAILWHQRADLDCLGISILLVSSIAPRE